MHPENRELERAITNMGIVKIQDVFLGKNCIDILHALGQETQLHALASLVLDRMSHAEMLRSKDMRSAIVMSMRQDDITRLAKRLGMDSAEDAYQSITRMSFRKNSESEQALFGFFGVPWIEHRPDEGPPDIELVKAERPLFEYQIGAVSRIKDILEHEGGRVLLHVPTGGGKTRIAMRVVADLLLENPSSLVIWLAYSEELCEQAIEEFKSAWRHTGNRDVSIYRLFGGHDTDVLGRECRSGLIVAGLSKVYRRARTNSMLLTTLADRASLVIIDEAHQAIAETYKLVLGYLVEKHDVNLVGLSATPGRTWNSPLEDRKLAEFFNEKKVTIETGTDPVSFLIKDGYLAKPNIEQIRHDGMLTNSDMERIAKSLEIPNDILDKLARDAKRNMLIIDKIKRLARDHRRIIVFAAGIRHARDISLVLHTMGHDASYVDSDTPKDVRNSLINHFREDTADTRIMCNFGVLTTGFDAPKTSAVLIARPTKSLILYSQMMGRAIRGPKMGGSKECDVVTVTDINLPGFNSIVDAFANWEDVWK
ncbi:superfamily II helicase [Cenarchaeum symbiosum A]|uniref:Superfamily II helicase n=1 Tax=Cenarchaeum symbiosum (strain A) TaxID=414004 RepID=A0RVA6_CENSY|nr:superfamily II helicase [Cenarchaeum symbiosum A]